MLQTLGSQEIFKKGLLSGLLPIEKVLGFQRFQDIMHVPQLAQIRDMQTHGLKILSDQIYMNLHYPVEIELGSLKNILLQPFWSNCKGNCQISTISARWWTIFLHIIKFGPTTVTSFYLNGIILNFASGKLFVQKRLFLKHFSNFLA